MSLELYDKHVMAGYGWIGHEDKETNNTQLRTG